MPARCAAQGRRFRHARRFSFGSERSVREKFIYIQVASRHDDAACSNISTTRFFSYFTFIIEKRAREKYEKYKFLMSLAMSRL